MYIPVVYMAREVMLLCGHYPLRGPLKEGSPEIGTFWALKWTRAKRVHLGSPLPPPTLYSVLEFFNNLWGIGT
jgi:hypothetical protein